MGFLMPKAPTPTMPPLPPPAAHPATLGSTEIQLSGQNSKKGAAVAEGMGANDTVKTSPQGLDAPKTAKTSLLGGG